VTPGVSVVICAHDQRRWESLVGAVASVEAQSEKPSEIIVAIDHNEPLLEQVRALLPRVTAIPNDLARGLGGARNSGVHAASGSVVAFLDDDAVADPEWLARLGAEYSDPSVAGVGGGILPMWPGVRPRWFPDEFDWVVGCTYRGLPTGRAPVRNLIGCNMSFRRELLEELGGFRLGYGCDETELCIRLRQRHPDLTVLYLPQARVHHVVPESRARVAYFLTRCFFEGESKAVVSQIVGRTDGLASELSYTKKVLPAGIVRGVADLARHGDVYGVARAAAIVGGLTTTGAGYAVGRARARRAAALRGWEGNLP
jgi:glycosyltransferase involved in cell wall biosynthesis